MQENIQTAAHAIAYGALAAGVQLVTSYPGTPGSTPAEILLELAEQHQIYFEWSLNERIALEMGIGASIAGRRALVCVKSVGMNVLLDPLMCLTYTGVHGGLVVLLGDDPGAYGSQNDQDSRGLAAFAEIPLLEPSDAGRAYPLMTEAFDLSERFQTPVVLRITRSFVQQRVQIEPPRPTEKRKAGELVRTAYRFVPYPDNAVALHGELHDRLERIGRWMNDHGFYRQTGSGSTGVITAGFCAGKLGDLFAGQLPEDLPVLRLESLFPLPEATVARFLAGWDQVLIIEESEPFVENQVRALAERQKLAVQILGKREAGLPSTGELFRWQIQAALAQVWPAFRPAAEYAPGAESQERPQRKGHCEECPYDLVMDYLEEAASRSGLEPVYVIDPGCMVTVAARVQAKFAIGSALAVADGTRKAGSAARAVALTGDSAYFHSTLPALCNLAVNDSDILIVVLDNGGSVTTGSQPSPNVGRRADGGQARRLDIAEIAKACGVRSVQQVDMAAGRREVIRVFQTGLERSSLTMVILRVDCGAS